MKKESLKEEIERLRQELYRVAERPNSFNETLIVSQKLDQLILTWMQMQTREFEKKKACNL